MKIGLALSGDGIKGAAAAGVLCALGEMSVDIDLLSATGSAALPAVLYACGVTGKEAFEAARRVLDRQGAGALRYKLYRMGGRDRVFRRDFMEKRIRRVLTRLEISSPGDFKKPVSIAAIDLITGCPVAFSRDIPAMSGAFAVVNSFDLNEALRAAMSHRGVLLPRVVGGMCLTDSGYRNLFSWPLRISGAGKVLVADLSGCAPPLKPGKVDLICREADLYAQKLLTDSSVSQFDLPICRDFKGAASFKDYFELGYVRTMELKEEIYDFLFFK